MTKRLNNEKIEEIIQGGHYKTKLHFQGFKGIFIPFFSGKATKFQGFSRGNPG
jgi:hypothetical protein